MESSHISISLLKDEFKVGCITLQLKSKRESDKGKYIHVLW